MSSIAYLGKDINEYNAKSREYLEELHLYCPEHGLELTYHTNYVRHIKDYSADIAIHRLKCPLKDCNYTQAIVPDFVQPYKHYSAHEIATVLIDAESDVCALAIETEASISTVRRWISQYQPILDKKISQIKALIFQIAKKVVNETTLPSGQPMEAVQRLLKILPAFNRTNTLGAAFIYVKALAIPT